MTQPDTTAPPPLTPSRPDVSTGEWILPPPRPAGAPPRAPVTVIVPTLNEERNLPRCLAALAWADEVVVVDSSSTDGTRRIALEHGAKVLNFRWDGRWPKKRNWVLRNAELAHEWILVVDADEVIVPELAAEVMAAVKDDRHVGYYINRRFMFLGQWIRHCGYYPSWNLRLLRRGHGEYEQIAAAGGDTGSGDNEVHEHVVADGPVGYLKHDMLHYAYPDVTTFVEKHNRYSNWEALAQLGNRMREGERSLNADLARRRRLKALSRRLPFRPTLRFLYAYVWRLGFLDGYAGLAFCRLLAVYELLSVIKYHELKRQSDAGQALASQGTAQLPAR